MAWWPGLAAGAVHSEAPEALQWVAGDLPPFAWMSSEGPQGYAQELAVALALRLGRSTQVDYLPWARAIRMTEEGDRYGIFPLTRTPERENRFRWLIPLATVPLVMVGKRAPRPLSESELRPFRVGVLRGSPWISELRARQFHDIAEGKDYRELLRMLDLGLIQVIFAGAPMLDAALVEYGYSRERFTTHVSLKESTLYMGTSLRVSDAEAQLWRQAYQQLVDDGTVARLRKKYQKALPPG